MSHPTFTYQAFREKETAAVTSLIAYQTPAQGPLEAVMWHAGRQEWIYAPAIAAGLLFDDAYRDEMTLVDRQTAETLAVQYLHSSLPSPETLQQMCVEGARMGWDYGRPRV
jgi:hypothetical protein